MDTGLQFLRRAQLIVTRADNTLLDLSEMHFKFKTAQSDAESPNNATIRVYNLSKERMDEITGTGSLEYSQVILDAGYQDSTQYGTIFNGTIKQFRRGREKNTDAYLDILAADGDIGYTFGFISHTFPAGSTSQQRIKAGIDAMGIKVGSVLLQANGTFGGVVPAPRSKVAFGLVRDLFRDEAATNEATWSVQDGALQMIPLTGFIPGETVVLNSFSGMIGIPEQTDEGIKVRCLLNPLLRIGGLIKINNNDINQITARGENKAPAGQVPFNQWTGIQFPADVSADGNYRLYVAEHCGDTRGNEWYTDLICLSIDSSVGLVPAYG